MTQEPQGTTTSGQSKKPRKKKVSSIRPWVAVIWHDVLDDSNEWKHGVPNLAPVAVTTVGILFEKKKDHILVVRDLYIDDAGEPVTGGRVAIPRGMIVSMTELEKKNEAGRNPQGSKRSDERGQGEGLRPSEEKP
jgi:hypothetical protein